MAHAHAHHAPAQAAVSAPVSPSALAVAPAPLATHSAQIRRLIDRHASLAAFAVRFAYGIRIAGPMLIGATSMPALRFAMLNAVSAITWALLVGGIGWLFGEAAETLFGHLAHIEGWLFAVLIVALVAWRVLRHQSAKA